MPGVAVPAHHVLAVVLILEDCGQGNLVAGGDDVAFEFHQGLEPVAVMVGGADTAAEVHPLVVVPAYHAVPEEAAHEELGADAGADAVQAVGELAAQG